MPAKRPEPDVVTLAVMPPGTERPAVPPKHPLTDDLVTLVEMVDLFGVKRVTVDQWAFRRRGAANPDLMFPEPDDYVGATPVWHVDRIKVWAELTGRPLHESAWREKQKAGGYATRRRITT